MVQRLEKYKKHCYVSIFTVFWGSAGLRLLHRVWHAVGTTDTQAKQILSSQILSSVILIGYSIAYDVIQQ